MKLLPFVIFGTSVAFVMGRKPAPSLLDETELNDIDQEDPETTPGLYQGDIAIDSNMDSYLRVGLHWETFQNRMWQNRTIPYVISPLYDAEVIRD